MFSSQDAFYRSSVKVDKNLAYLSFLMKQKIVFISSVCFVQWPWQLLCDIDSQEPKTVHWLPEASNNNQMALMLIQINKCEPEIKTQQLTGCLMSLMLVQHNKLKLHLKTWCRRSLSKCTGYGWELNSNFGSLHFAKRTMPLITASTERSPLQNWTRTVTKAGLEGMWVYLEFCPFSHLQHAHLDK